MWTEGLTQVIETLPTEPQPGPLAAPLKVCCLQKPQPHHRRFKENNPKLLSKVLGVLLEGGELRSWCHILPRITPQLYFSLPGAGPDTWVPPQPLQQHLPPEDVFPVPVRNVGGDGTVALAAH